MAASAEGFFRRTLTAACFQASGKVAVSMEVIKVRASLIGVDVSDGAPEWMVFIIAAVSSVVMAFYLVRVFPLSDPGRLVTRN